MSVAGTASSNSNARTSVNSRAFILRSHVSVQYPFLHVHIKRYALNKREAVSLTQGFINLNHICVMRGGTHYTRPWTADEGETLAPDAWETVRYRGVGFPAFRTVPHDQWRQQEGKFNESLHKFCRIRTPDRLVAVHG
jgi:hypothetical protein